MVKLANSGFKNDDEVVVSWELSIIDRIKILFSPYLRLTVHSNKPGLFPLQYILKTGNVGDELKERSNALRKQNK